MAVHNNLKYCLIKAINIFYLLIINAPEIISGKDYKYKRN